MPNQVLPEIKEERSKKVIELSNKIQNEYNREQIGKIVKVLVEEKNEKYYKGHTANYMCVMIETERENIENNIVEVRIKDSQNETLLRRTNIEKM